MVKEPLPLVMERLPYNGVNIIGTSIGTRQQMKVFLQIAARKKIAIDIETVSLHAVNAAIERLAMGKVKGRFVIDFTKV